MSEHHVCGVLSMARPESSVIVEQIICDMDDVEMHAIDSGRMVVTVEGDSYRQCADVLTELSTIDGVASPSLVYHEIDTEELL